MYIKKLTIQGFKSYKDQVVVEPFSPGHNVVVGRNGSGKSNFFAAIRFVLNDAYTRLGQEERQALLHEGSGQPSISAFVEVVFDNGDGRFPTGKEEVVLRRTIGLKKDEYSLDRKTVTKNDVMNLLQSAGFSKANPYYIVPQGRITALTNARDTERLELLKEVAGTRVYEEHRQESLRIMEETEGKRAKIVELLAYIDERLEELAEEKEELQKWQTLDRQKRAVELALHTREQTEAVEALERLEEEYRTACGGEEDLDATVKSPEDEMLTAHLSAVAQIEKELLDARSAASEARRDVEASTADVEEARQQRAHVAVALGSARDDSKTSSTQANALRPQLQRLEAEIERKESELVQLQPLLAEAAQSTLEQKRQLTELETAMDALQGKQGRSAQFASAAERDRWIRKELTVLDTTQRLQTEQVAAAQETLHASTARISALQTQLRSLEDAQIESRARERECTSALADAKGARDVATDARKELWRAEGKLEAALVSIGEQITAAERTVQASMDMATWQGMEAVQRLAVTLNLTDRVHGPLYRLFSVDDELFRPAVESIAGASLFHVVVEDEDVATQLLQGLQRERSGRVTFVPLNRLRVHHRQRQARFADSDEDSDQETIPSDSAQWDDPEEAIPLLSKIQSSDARFRDLLQSVFGGVVVVPALSSAVIAKARRARCTAITVSGDRADRKGTLSGGYRDPRSSRLDSLVRLQMWKQRSAEHETLLVDLKQRLHVADQHVTRTVAAVVALEQQMIGGGARRLVEQMEATAAEIGGARELAEHQTARLSVLHEEASVLAAKQKSLQAELGQPLQRTLSAEETEQLAKGPRDIDSLRRALDETDKQRTLLAARATALEQLLEQNLRRRRLALLAQLASLAPADAKALELADQLAGAETQLKEAETRLAEARSRLLASEEALRVGEAALDRSRADGEQVSRACDSRAALLERFLSRRTLLAARRDDAARRIRELGVISEDAHDQVRDLTTTALLSCLSDLTASIKAGFSAAPVNRKAADQHATFSRQAEALRTRQTELDASATAIRGFVATLDRRKEEAIMRTFAQVQGNFERVFERLCPAGSARLLMLREEASDSQASGDATTLSMTGIAIKASFSGKAEGDGLLTSQLSGGQKSLLALALIFAIQLVDPAPFYLFDEIDANLDAAARSAVAALIATLSKSSVEAGKLGGENARAAPPAQFIITTFRPEMVKEADAFFGVSFGQRVSRVDRITSNEALQFIEHEATI